MPNNPRQSIKRDLDSAINHIGHILGILDSKAGLYKEAAPEYVERYEIAFKLAIELGELLESIRDAT